MNIETKYDAGQKVFFIYQNQVQHVAIGSVKTETSFIYPNSHRILYYIDMPAGNVMKEVIFDEGQLFSTKEDLLKSL